jgi:hypothetical protein
MIAFHEGEGKDEDIGGRDAEEGDGQTLGQALAEGETYPDAREGAGAEGDEQGGKVLDGISVIPEQLRDVDGEHLGRVTLRPCVALLDQAILPAEDEVEEVHGIVEAEDKPI